MKKLIKLMTFFLVTSLLIGCSNDHSGLQTATTNHIQNTLDNKDSGFIVITNETEAVFLDEVQNILLEKDTTALLFNVFRNDGENKNKDGLSHNPFDFEMPSVNALYYIQDGEVYDQYDLEQYVGLNQQTELSHFLEVTNRSNSYE